MLLLIDAIKLEDVGWISAANPCYAIATPLTKNGNVSQVVLSIPMVF